jgi:ribosome-associated protein
VADPLPITADVVIPGEDLTLEVTRSSGPGGQHVNTTDSRVRLRFALDRCAALGEATKERLRRARPGLVTEEGELVIACQTHRSQHRNLDEARERLAVLIRAALTPPKPRRATRPSRGVKQRRLDDKRHQSERKAGRRQGAPDP